MSVAASIDDSTIDIRQPRRNFSPDAALSLLNAWISEMVSLNLGSWLKEENQSFVYQFRASKALSDTFFIGSTTTENVFVGVNTDVGWLLNVPWRRVYAWNNSVTGYLAFTAYVDMTPFSLIFDVNQRVIHEIQSKKCELICLSEIGEVNGRYFQSGMIAIPLMIADLNKQGGSL